MYNRGPMRLKSPKRKSKKRLAKRSIPIAPAPMNESEEIVFAIRSAKIDALVADGGDGEQVFTLQGTEHPYRVLVEAINDGAATLDADGTVLYANNRFSEILGISLDRLVGVSLQERVSSSGREVLSTLIAEGLLRDATAEIKLEAADGQAHLVRFRLTPVKNGDLQNICVVATELTELVEANEALRSSEEALRQLSGRLLQLQDEERRRVARDLHDITGQKLALQSMALSRLLNQDAPKLDAESERTLSECVTLNKEISEEIRTLSYVLHPPLLDELGLASAAKWYAQGFEQRTGIHIDVDVSADFLRLPPDVEVTLFRIIQESLTNVHRYSGSPTASVHVKASFSDIKLQIRDSGRGMKPESPKPLHGAEAVLGVGIQGMKERMRQLGGKLEITSQPNHGTIVTATLPLANVRVSAPPEATIRAAASSAETLREQTADTGEIARKRVLVVDDHELLRRGVCTMLMNEPSLEICGEAADGQEAVTKAAALHPDLVIIDINMPGLNGLAVIRQITRILPQTKILVFTVHDSDQMIEDTRAAGAHGCLSKNKAGQDLLRVARQLLESKPGPTSESKSPNASLAATASQSSAVAD